MPITFDQLKRDVTLAERGLDFADATAVFAGITLTREDTRFAYGETRYQTYGLFDGRMDGGLDGTWRGSPRHVDEVLQ